MIVPHGDHRHLLMKLLQRRIAAIAGVAQAIVGECDRSVQWQHLAPRQRPVRVGALGVFVDIVAEVDSEVDVPAACRIGISVEPTEADVGAGKDAEPELVGIAFGQSAGPPGAAHRRPGAAGASPDAAIFVKSAEAATSHVSEVSCAAA